MSSITGMQGVKNGGAHRRRRLRMLNAGLPGGGNFDLSGLQITANAGEEIRAMLGE